jgi:hypothetical protein
VELFVKAGTDPNVANKVGHLPVAKKKWDSGLSISLAIRAGCEWTLSRIPEKRRFITHANPSEVKLRARFSFSALIFTQKTTYAHLDHFCGANSLTPCVVFLTEWVRATALLSPT